MGNYINCCNSLYSLLKRIFETMKSLFVHQHKHTKSLIENIENLTKIETKLQDFEFYNYTPPIINDSLKMNESFLIVRFSSSYNENCNESTNIKSTSSNATSCINDDLISCSDEVIFAPYISHFLTKNNLNSSKLNL